VVIGGIAGTSLLDLADRGVKVLGEVPQGLPGLALPAVGVADLNTVLPLALACFLLATVETAAIGRMFARKHDYRFDTNDELLGIAAANAMAGLGRGFPVSGGMSQSLVNESGGARTPLSGLVAALLVGAVVVFLSGALRDLPQPVLAAIVLVAVTGLFKVSALRHLWQADRAELVVAIAALLGVLGSGLLRGVLIGATISIAQLLHRASRPHVAFLGRIPGTQRFSDLARHSDNEQIPGALLFRVEAGLLYFNADYVSETVLARAAELGGGLRLVVADLSSSPRVDLGAAEMLAALRDELAERGARLRLVGAHSAVRERLDAEGLGEILARGAGADALASLVEEHLARPDWQHPA
jgi:MFS superfamily sulfate permease-like transporter